MGERDVGGQIAAYVQMTKMDLKGTSFCLFLFALTLGCSAGVTSEQTGQRWLYFLADGETKKIVIISRLGKPSAQFQGGRILTYRLKIDHKGVLRPVSQSLEEFVIDRKLYDVNSMYSLVLIFDEKEILRRHSLVNIIP